MFDIIPYTLILDYTLSYVYLFAFDYLLCLPLIDRASGNDVIFLSTHTRVSDINIYSSNRWESNH